jgi:hypothetical protein
LIFRSSLIMLLESTMTLGIMSSHVFNDHYIKFFYKKYLKMPAALTLNAGTCCNISITEILDLNRVISIIIVAQLLLKKLTIK